jgi:hypothetical protein
VQEIEGHAEQQAEQHHRRAIVLRQPRRRQSDGQGHQHARIDGEHDVAAGQAMPEARRLLMAQGHHPLETVERHHRLDLGHIPAVRMLVHL